MTSSGTDKQDTRTVLPFVALKPRFHIKNINYDRISNLLLIAVGKLKNLLISLKRGLEESCMSN